MLRKYHHFMHRIRVNVAHNKRLKDLVAKEIYGTIVVIGTVVFLEGHNDTPIKIIFKIIGTAFILGLAEGYSEFIGRSLRRMKFLPKDEFIEIIEEVGEVLTATIIPVIIFLLALLKVIPLNIAFLATKVFGVFILFFYGFLCGEVFRATRLGKFIYGFISGFLGFFIILLKACMH